jgi:hypothetical protein
MNKNLSFVIGRAAALAIAVVTIVFAISLIWEVINLSEFAKNLGYVASILIAIGVVIVMACFYDGTREQLKIFGLLALMSSIIYAPFCIGPYFLQLSIVASNPLNLSSEVLEAINFKPGSPAFAIDMLGYCFLCLSTLVAGFALTEAYVLLFWCIVFMPIALLFIRYFKAGPRQQLEFISDISIFGIPSEFSEKLEKQHERQQRRIEAAAV